MFFLENSLDIDVILDDIYWNSRLIFLTNTTNRIESTFPNHLLTWQFRQKQYNIRETWTQEIHSNTDISCLLNVPALIIDNAKT